MPRPKGSKNKAKKFEPTDQDRIDVCAMITDNNFMAPIARLMGLTEVKFKKVFAYEIKFGKDMAVSNVKKALYKKAIEEKNVTAQLGFLNNYDDNVKNKSMLELTGKDGTPIQLANASQTDLAQRFAHVMWKEKQDAKRKGLPPKTETTKTEETEEGMSGDVKG